MESKHFKSKVLAYTDTVQGRIDEELHGKWISEQEYNYLQNNKYKISMNCIKEFKNPMTLEEELKILDKNIKIVLMEMQTNDKECSIEEEIQI